MQHCEHCNQDFYSDTEFDQHQQFVQLTEMVSRAAKANKELTDRVGWISAQLEIANILVIMRHERVSWEKAIVKHLEYADVRNRYLENYHEKQYRKVKNGVV